jgi:hypothetical protein
MSINLQIATLLFYQDTAVNGQWAAWLMNANNYPTAIPAQLLAT